VLVAEDMLSINFNKNDIRRFWTRMWYCWKRKIAIEKLQNNTYDIVLMDIQMPEINGFEATEFIRKKWNLKFHYCSNGRCYNYRHQKVIRNRYEWLHLKTNRRKLLYNKINELLMR
jgi:CheY-like chemotaxis protein